MKKIVFVLIIVLAFSASAKELIASNGKKLQIEKVNLDKYGPGLDWYAEKYPDWGYCDGMGYSECEGAGPDCEEPDFNFQCQAAPEEIENFTPEQIKSLINAMAFGGMVDGRVREILVVFYKNLQNDPDNKRYKSIKDYAYSKDVLGNLWRATVYDALLYIPQSLPYYREIVKDALQKNGNLFKNLPENIKSDKEIALIVIKQSGSYFQYLPEKLRDDKEIVLKVLSMATSDYFNQYISARLQKDPDILKAQAKIPENKKDFDRKIKELSEKR